MGLLAQPRTLVTLVSGRLASRISELQPQILQSIITLLCQTNRDFSPTASPTPQVWYFFDILEWLRNTQTEPFANAKHMERRQPYQVLGYVRCYFELSQQFFTSVTAIGSFSFQATTGKPTHCGDIDERYLTHGIGQVVHHAQYEILRLD
ncbi:hypothetical protein GLAREA_11977 [Glarea lozoyensis ATCC 20868]|uniref:Uncharacterized protein n=1 Tax=Glarea lozoyensis (strain ATCC 20868 / MF5171) TaxID=1116229 RepID=S3D259_GLAL2|nr:uncharacterized protein GLAREA_11977 [Glarea lozoyensis ATCC 20868]EPE31895.1 hypothetical protein GLAREA_11977 [Glarea lozoyensis ATCC 20868]